MASIACDPNGRKRIQFFNTDGERKTIRLGKATVKQAEGFKVRVEQLVMANMTGGGVDPETAMWLTTRDDTTYAKLADAGLVAPRASAKLGAFIDEYIKGRCDIKAGTATVLGHTRRNLIDHFGEEKPLREITPGDADKWRLYLIGLGLCSSTVGRRVKIAKQFLKAAVRRGLVQSNPFADLKSTAAYNPAKFRFITQDEAQKVIDACPDAQWRLLFALSRYGGLRCPSEHLALKWSDIDFEHNRILVHSPKTEHHVGGESRLIPLFPELLPYLLEVFSQPDAGEYVITRYRHTNANLRTQLERIIRKAGLKPWPKPFQNLRSTRETELAETWPEHVVCAWIGNTVAVARKHYLQVTDEHFEQAAIRGKPTPQEAEKEAAQKAAQQTDALPGNESHPVTETAFCDELQVLAGQCFTEVGPVGFEPTTKGL